MIKVAINSRGRRIGQGHHRAKYSDSLVSRIVELHQSGIGYRQLARKFDIPRSTIADICTGAIRGDVAETHTDVGGTDKEQQESVESGHG
jgi:transposase-like protein